jgi:hypothetical protein
VYIHVNQINEYETNSNFCINDYRIFQLYAPLGGRLSITQQQAFYQTTGQVVLSRFCSYLDIIKLKVMKIELCISKDRVPYIVDFLGKDRVTVSEHNEEQDQINFELRSQLDVLHMFHAGIKCGSESMAKAFTK